MKFLPRTALSLLVAVLALPVLVMVGNTARLLMPLSPNLLRLRDGSEILAVPLPRDHLERVGGRMRVLLADGSVQVLSAMPLAMSVDTSTWVVRRDDGPMLLGRLRGVVSDAGDTIRGAAARRALENMPALLRIDRNRLVRLVRKAGGVGEFADAMRRWTLFEAADRRIEALFSGLDGSVRAVRLSSVREVSLAPSGLLDGIWQTLARLRSSLSRSPDAWDGGGLRPVVAGTLALILLSGLAGGLPALLAALQLADRGDPGWRARWVRRFSEWFAAVPGVVWGTIGAGLLVAGLGASMDRFLSDGVRWGGGGMLWGALTLGALSAPVTLARALSALDRVPRVSREIARSCGATRWQVLRWIILPASARGLAGAWFSGLARAAGEIAPLLMVGAARALGGDVLDPSLRWPSLSGGFLHLGVLACDPPWPPLEAELGHPLAFLSLSLLALLCLALEFVAVRLLARRDPAVPG